MLIVATGAQYNYFGHDRWRMPAPNLKTLEGVLTVRRRILGALEAAELESDPQRRASWLTFVVVGAGPTGVEMAGQIAESRRTCAASSARSVPAKLRSCSSNRRPGPAGFPPSLSARAERSLARLGVTILHSTCR